MNISSLILFENKYSIAKGEEETKSCAVAGTKVAAKPKTRTVSVTYLYYFMTPVLLTPNCLILHSARHQHGMKKKKNNQKLRLRLNLQAQKVIWVCTSYLLNKHIKFFFYHTAKANIAVNEEKFTPEATMDYEQAKEVVAGIMDAEHMGHNCFF